MTSGAWFRVVTRQWGVAIGLILVVMFNWGIPPALADQTDAVGIGDSVMLGAKPQLLESGLSKVDAKVSRQASEGPGILRSWGSKLPNNVVVHLGTNGTIALKDCRDMVTAVGSDRTLYLVTVKVPRFWEKRNNRVLRACQRSFAGTRVVLVDWYAVATENPEYLYADGYHLRPDGVQAYVDLIQKAIGPRPVRWDRW